MPAFVPQTLFVTGASAGIGQAIARRALADGCSVWGTARDAARLGELRQRAGFHPVVLDLADEEASLRAYREAAAEAGGFDVVVNNAGYGLFAPFDAVDFAVWRAQIDAMLVHTAALVHAQLADLGQRPSGGVLVNTASLATEFPLPFMSAYNIAKAGLSALSESLLVETRGTPVSVIDFRPGDFRTGFNQSMQRPAIATASRSTAADLTTAWRALEGHLHAAPPPDRAADQLWRAVRGRHRGRLRAGGVFQTVLAPLFERLVPLAWARAVRWRYFGLR